MGFEVKHGHAKTRLYNIWAAMRYRCHNPNCKYYHNYGGRGIKICSEWDEFACFEAWAYENGYDDNAPKGKISLDRKDVDGDYCPENCRWISMYDQQDNKQDTIKLTYNGQTRTIREWAKITGITHNTIWHRYKMGHPIEDVLFSGDLHVTRKRDSKGRYVRR